MEELPYNNLDELTYYLQLTFSGQNDDVQKATRIFNQMSQNVAQLFDSLIMVIVNERNDQDFNKIKNAACLVLASHIPLLVQDQNLSLETRAYLANAVISTLFLDSVILPLKLTLQTVLKALYRADTSAYLRNQGLLLVKEKLASTNMDDYAATLLILQAIINTPQTTQQALVQWFVDLRKHIMISGNNIITGIASEIEDLLRGNGNQEEKVISICIGLRILNLWINLMRDIFKQLANPDSKTRLVTKYIEVIANDDLLIKIYSNVLTLQVPSNEQIEQCLFSTSGITDIDELLNSTKSLILKDLNFFLEIINSSKSFVNFFDTEFYKFIQENGIKGVLNSVFVFCKSSVDIEQALKNRSLNYCLTECLVFLTSLTPHERLNEIFSNYKKQLLLDVCLPLMRSTESEFIMFQNDCSQFVYLAADTCYQQKSGVVKTQATQLLERVCENIHGALSYVVVLLVNVIEYSLVSNNPDELPLKYESLEPKAKFITQTSSKIRVETSLIALSVIDYLVASRSDLINRLETLFTSYQLYFFGNSSDAFVKSRTCLFIEHYIETLFQEEEKEEMFKTFLKFIVECMGYQSQEYGALSEQAIESLSFIFKEQDLTIKLSPFVNDILQELIFYAKSIRSTKFYEILEEIVKNYSHHLRQNPNLLGGFLEVLVDRVQIEYENSKQNRKCKKILIDKSWGIFISIAENKLYMANYQEDIEKILAPLFNYLSTDQDVPFEEHILKYMISAIKLSKRVSNTCWELFKAFPTIFLQKETISSLMFKALNKIIVYGRNVLENDNLAIKALINMGIRTVNTAFTKQGSFDICKGALLLQLVIQYFGNITPDDWNEILSVCTDILFKVEQDFVKTKLAGVILCMFFTNFQSTQKLLSSKNVIEDLLSLFLKETLSFEGNMYDRKVLIIGLSSFFGQQNLNPLIYQNLHSILDVVVSVLKYIQFKDAELRKEKAKNPEKFEDNDISKSDLEMLKKFLKDENCIENENDFSEAIYEEEEKKSSDSDEDTISEDSNKDIFTDYVDQSETNMIVDSMETELKNRDEFKIFQDFFLQMKDNDLAYTMELIERLSKEKKEFLKDTLQSKRVVINPNEGKTESRRIVKPKARKIAQNLNDSD